MSAIAGASQSRGRGGGGRCDPPGLNPVSVCLAHNIFFVTVPRHKQINSSKILGSELPFLENTFCSRFHDFHNFLCWSFCQFFSISSRLELLDFMPKMSVWATQMTASGVVNRVLVGGKGLWLGSSPRPPFIRSPSPGPRKLILGGIAFKLPSSGFR